MSTNQPDLVLLTDPEMVSEMVDKITGPVCAVAYWLDGGLGDFATLDALLAVRTAYEQEANARTTAWQGSLLPPAWLLWRISDDLTVFGSIPDPEMLAAAEATHGATPAEIAMQAYRAGEARSRGWLWGRWFSPLVPDGEWGAAHCAEITRPLTQQQFDGYRARGWVDVDA